MIKTFNYSVKENTILLHKTDKLVMVENLVRVNLDIGNYCLHFCFLLFNFFSCY